MTYGPDELDAVTFGRIQRMPVELLEAKIKAFNRIVTDEGIYFPYRGETHGSHSRKVRVAKSLLDDIENMWSDVYWHDYQQDPSRSDRSSLKKASRIAREQMSKNEYEQLEKFSKSIRELQEMFEQFLKVIQEEDGGQINTGLSKREKQDSIIQIAFTYGFECFNDEEYGPTVRGRNLDYEFLDTNCITEYRDVVVEHQKQLKEEQKQEVEAE